MGVAFLEDSLLMSDGGTSIAAPIVAGYAATLRSALIHSGRGTAAIGDAASSSSAALVKVLLINSAVTLVGPGGAALPMAMQGFGRVDMCNSLPPRPNPVGTAYPVDHGYEDRGLGEGLAMSGLAWSMQKEIPEGQAGRKFRVTMVYTDREGPTLQNRLLLELTHEAAGVRETKEVNIFEGVVRSSNVQQVVWDNIQAGTLTIRVVAAHILARDEGQRFAVVWRLIEAGAVGAVVVTTGVPTTIPVVQPEGPAVDQAWARFMKRWCTPE